MNIYIWTDTLSLSANLKSENLSDLQNAWWTDWISDGSYTWDSNGLKLPSVSDSSQNNKSVRIYYYTEDLTTNSKITIHATWFCDRTYSGNSYQYNSAMFIWLNPWTTWRWETWFWWWYNASNATWLNTGVILNNTVIWQSMSWNVWWNVDIEMVIDLKNKTAKYTTTSPVSQTTTSTLTDAQITTILTYKYITILACRAEKTVATGLYTASITIE